MSAVVETEAENKSNWEKVQRIALMACECSSEDEYLCTSCFARETIEGKFYFSESDLS